MAQTIEAIVILLIVWQLMTRFKKNVRISSNGKSELQEAIEDAKDRLPSTGLFKLFKGDSINPEAIEQPEIEIERTFVPAKGDKQKESE